MGKTLIAGVLITAAIAGGAALLAAFAPGLLAANGALAFLGLQTLGAAGAATVAASITAPYVFGGALVINSVKALVSNAGNQHEQSGASTQHQQHYQPMKQDRGRAHVHQQHQSHDSQPQANPDAKGGHVLRYQNEQTGQMAGRSA